MSHLKLATLLRIVPLFFLKLIGSVHNASSPPPTSPSSSSPSPSPPIDPEGYLISCLCMGRLGNQMEHFLGTLDFARRLNRTLVLPPFAYSDSYRKVNWNEWFQVKPLRQYHRVILADPFMKLVAPKAWPVGRRVGFCWRHPSEERASRTESEGSFRCDMSGDRVGAFWRSIDVEFDSYVGNFLSYQDPEVAWKTRYPGSAFPVLALRSAPAPYPMRASDWHLQKYVRFSEDIERQTDKFVKGFIGEGKKFVGIHLRNGVDWERTCETLLDPNSEWATAPKLLSSPQCYGENHETNSAPFAHVVCYQPKSLVVDAVKRAVDFIGAKLVYIATDQTPFREDIQKEMKSRKVDVMFLDPDLPLYDLSILSRADLFIGNCFSSFSSFVRRSRDAEGKPTWYFGMN